MRGFNDSEEWINLSYLTFLLLVLGTILSKLKIAKFYNIYYITYSTIYIILHICSAEKVREVSFKNRFYYYNQCEDEIDLLKQKGKRKLFI